jgi:transcriptional regulator with XRE-family HTH domain
MEAEYKEFLSALGRRIKDLRKARGWSLRDMVMLHRYHDSQWRRYESGGGLTIPSLLRIAGLFEVSLSKLLDGLAEFPRKSVLEIEEQHEGVIASIGARRGSEPRKTKHDVEASGIARPARKPRQTK